MLNNDKVVELYQSISDGNERRVMERWHASSLAQCPRSQYFQRLGVESLAHPSAAKILRWNSGHAIEGAIREHVEKVYGKVKSNQRYESDKLDLTGEFDNLAITEKRLVEIKSVHDMAFYTDKQTGVTGLKVQDGTHSWRGKDYPTWVVSQKPYKHHEIQNHAYVLLLEEQGIKVRDIDYVYISLGGRIAVYSTKVQPELISNVKSRLSALETAWRTKQPPVCICAPEHELWGGVLQWCDYRNETTGKCCDLSLVKEDKS